MTHIDKTLSFSLHEVCKEKMPLVTYDELLKLADNMEMQTMVAMDDYIALEMEYGDNYTKRDLDKIAEYYEISKRNKKKQDLIEAVVLFEKMPENVEAVYTRKRLWGYIQEIKADKYLSKYLIFD